MLIYFLLKPNYYFLEKPLDWAEVASVAETQRLDTVLRRNTQPKWGLRRSFFSTSQEMQNAGLYMAHIKKIVRRFTSYKPCKYVLGWNMPAEAQFF